jgi:hypothetical protein
MADKKKRRAGPEREFARGTALGRLGDIDVSALAFLVLMQAAKTAMDRMAKTMSTLSNLLKKTSDTAAAIAANLK